MALAASPLTAPTKSADDEIDPPLEFGRYQLSRRLGHGGFATVFLALEASASGKPREVVVKRLHEHLAVDERAREAFLDEARLAIGLSHPNIVSALDFGSIDGRPFLAMEYMLGADLDRVLEGLRAQGQKLKPELALQIALDLLEGLAYLHERRDPSGRPAPIVHRDVSPHNAFVTHDGVVKLLDFGIAKARARAVETTTGVVKGKFAYMSPEQANGESVEPSADVWSLGVVLWEMLAGQRLFEASSAFSTLASSMLGAIPRLDKLSDVPESLATVVGKALERSPAARYQTAREFATALQGVLSAHTVTDRTHVAELVEGLFGDALTRAREESVRRVVRGASSHKRSILPWVLSGGVSLLMLGLFAIQAVTQSPAVEPETTSNPARGAEAEPVLPAAAAPEPEPQAPPAPAQPPPVDTAPSAPPPQRAPRANTKPRGESAAVPVGTGRISLVTVPWSEVWSGGKLLGTTPLIKLELPAGKHELILKNPRSGVQKTLRIELAEGQLLQRRVVLDANEAPQ